MKPKTKRSLKITAISVVTILVILLGGFYIYTLDYYRADDVAIEALATVEGENQGESRIQRLDDMWVFHPSEEQKIDEALIFYPGGKVEAKAYAPLLKQLSEQGITCVLMKMPFNLAVFDVNAADRVYDQFPDIAKWYIGGHSLGGAMASSYADKNSEKIEGLILLGAYSVAIDSPIPTLAIYGSEDMVLDREKLANTENKHELSGGNHAYFGNYGEQKGDGTASITREEQQRLTVEKVVDFIAANKVE